MSSGEHVTEENVRLLRKDMVTFDLFFGCVCVISGQTPNKMSVYYMNLCVDDSETIYSDMS